MSNIMTMRVDIKDTYQEREELAFVPDHKYAAKVVLRYFENQIDEQMQHIEAIIDDLNSQNPDERDLEELVTEKDSLDDYISDWKFTLVKLMRGYVKFSVAGVEIQITKKEKK